MKKKQSGVFDFDVPKEAIWVLVAVIGAVVKIALGSKDLGVKAWVVFLISITTGYLAAQYIDGTEYADASYFVGYAASITALNFTKAIAAQGFAGVLETIIKTGKK